MIDRRRFFHRLESRNEYEAHWFWAVTFVLAPIALLAVGFLGLLIGSSVPLRVAETSPKAALTLAAIGIGAALIRRRKRPIQVAGTGMAISLVGYLWLLWVS